MIRNFFQVAFRSLYRDKGYALLNILGLTIGITFSLLLIFYVLDELSFDRFHKNADRICRIDSYVQEPGKSMQWSYTQFTTGPQLKIDYPEVEHAVRFMNAQRTMYGSGDKKFYEPKMFYTDSNVFKVFSYDFLYGDPETALVPPKSIVLTEELAKKYFGQAQTALGQSLPTSDGDVYKVTGVLKDVPKNSHIIFNGLISTSSLPKNFGNSWGNFGYYTYVLLRPHVDRIEFDKKLLPMYDKYMAPLFAQFNIKMQYKTQPITKIHLESTVTGEPEELGSMSYIYIFSSVALFMLIIASINYMNLTTARSARRAKEIGIRKVAGSTKKQLVSQFLAESVGLTLISLIISLGLLFLLLPYFNSISGKHLSFFFAFKPISILVMMCILVLVGILGGSYPAFYLAKFNPALVLKGSLSKSSSNATLRRGLVITQFSISMVMIICTWVVYSQLQYMRTKDLGFDKEQVLKMVNSGANANKVEEFRNELKNSPQVSQVSLASAVPGSDDIAFNLFSVETKNGFLDKGVNCYSIDKNYFSALGIKLLEGRNFDNPSDTGTSIIVNENMAQVFGWDHALNKKIKFPGDTTGLTMQVVGVVKDFNQKSLYNPIEPLILFYSPRNNGIIAKINGDIKKGLSSVEVCWKKFFPAQPFNYTFLDEDLNSQYEADQKRGKIFTAFSVLTIMITCLGLIGLISFTTEQRQKEISIRKVLGARIPNIVSLLASNFILLVGLSCLIAFPIAYYFMHKWLDVFPYKIGLNPSIFIFSATVVLFITALTISFHTIKVAIANPVKSLRTE